MSARSTRLVSGHGLHPVSATPAYANPCRSNSIGSYNRSSDCRRLGWSSRRARTRQNRAIITGDVRRFGHVINTDGVFGTHRCTSSEPGRPGVMGVHRPFRSDRRNRGVSVVAAPQRIRTGPTMPAQCLDTAYSAADALVGGERWIQFLSLRQLPVARVLLGIWQMTRWLRKQLHPLYPCLGDEVAITRDLIGDAAAHGVRAFADHLESECAQPLVEFRLLQAVHRHCR